MTHKEQKDDPKWDLKMGKVRHTSGERKKRKSGHRRDDQASPETCRTLRGRFPVRQAEMRLFFSHLKRQ